VSWVAIKWGRKQRAGSVIAKAVLMNLSLHADEKGYCWPSQETMAREIECSVDSVQRVLKKLEPRLLRRIKRKSSDGRRISDAYQLRLDRESEDSQSNSRRTAAGGLVEDGDRAAKNPIAEPQKAASPNCTVRPKYLEENLQESSCRRLSETPGGVRLQKKLGKAVFDSWFAKVILVGVRDQLLILQAPTAHTAEKIAQWFDSEIVRCFEPEYKEVVRVSVIIRKITTSSEGGTQNSS
jgi:hypothetical protein